MCNIEVTNKLDFFAQSFKVWKRTLPVPKQRLILHLPPKKRSVIAIPKYNPLFHSKHRLLERLLVITLYPRRNVTLGPTRNFESNSEHNASVIRIRLRHHPV